MPNRKDHLTFGACLAMLREHASIPVRICPLGRNHCGGSDWGFGTLVAATKRAARVRPFRHKNEELIRWEYLRVWHAGLVQQGEQRKARARCQA